jgi:tetratricopeptide (TPR) repeat protein
MVLRKLIVGLLLGAIASGSQQSFAQHRKAPFLEQVIRGVDAITRDQPQRAIAYFAAALMQKKESRLDVLVGLAALSAKKPKLATAKLERAIRKGVNSADVLYWAARAQLARGDVKAALSRVEQAVAIAPKNPTLLVGYALIAKRAKRSNIAREQLARLVVRLPHLRDVRLYPSAKMGAIEQLQRLAPKTTQAKRLVAHLYWRAGAPLAAAPLLLELMRNPKDGDARQLLARVYHALGQTGAAIALARRAVEATPSNAMARATLGELLLSQKKAKQARPPLDARRQWASERCRSARGPRARVFSSSRPALCQTLCPLRPPSSAAARKGALRRRPDRAARGTTQKGARPFRALDRVGPDQGGLSAHRGRHRAAGQGLQKSTDIAFAGSENRPLERTARASVAAGYPFIQDT